MDQYFADFGPDATPMVDAAYLETRAKRMPKSTIKKFLLDQHVIAGVGNIYADEVLYELRMYPGTLVSKLKMPDWAQVAKVADEKLRFAIGKGGDLR